MEFPKKISLNGTLTLFEGRKPDNPNQPDVEKVIFDGNSLQINMNTVAEKLADLYDEISMESEGTVVDRPDVWKKRVPIAAQVVDESVPLTLFTMKTYTNEKHVKEIETISFDLAKTRVSENNADALYKAWRTSLSDGSHISHLEFVDNGDLFNLIDRETSQKFRGQGFANNLLNAAESFFRARATEKQKATTVFADTAQLDVICWLYNRGYRPQTDEDAKRLGEVLDGDSNIEIGENNYIFKNVSEESRIKRLPDGRVIPDRHNAYRIRLVKEIPPGQAKSISNIRQETGDLIKNV